MRARRSLLNFATSNLFLVVSMAVGLKATPWLVAWLGKERYGGFRVLGDTYGYLTLLELGLGGALAPMLAKAVGDRDEAALRRTVAAGVRAYLRVAAATLALGLVLTPFVPLLVDKLDPALADDLRTAWLVGLGSFLSLAGLPLRTVVEARQLGYVVNLLLTGQSLVITGASLYLAWAGWGITGQAVGQLVGVWAFTLTTALGVFATHPGLFRAVLDTPTAPETRRALRGLSVPALVLNVCGRVSLLTDNLIVGKTLDFARVTSFSNTQRLIQVGQGVLQGVGGATWAALAELHAQGHRETFNRRLVEISRTVAVLGLVGLVPVVAYNRAFVRVWMGPAFEYAGDLVTVAAAVNAVLLAEFAFWIWCLSVTGELRRALAPSVAAAVVNVTASVVLTRTLGLAGPLLGTTLAFVTVNLWAFPLLLRSAFGTPIGPLLLAIARPFLVGALAAAALRWLAWRFPPSGWAGLAAGMGLSALALAALSAAVLLTPEDRAGWIDRLRRAPFPRGGGGARSNAEPEPEPERAGTGPNP